MSVTLFYYGLILIFQGTCATNGVRSFSKIIYIPNSEVSSSKIVNYTNEDKRRVDFVFSAGYDCPVETVKLAIREAIEKFPQVFAEPAPFVRVGAYKDSVTNTPCASGAKPTTTGTSITI